MLLGEKRSVREYTPDGNWVWKTESNLHYGLKNLAALGATSSLAYLAFKYGFSESAHLLSSTFSFAQNVSSNVKDEVSTNFLVSAAGLGGGTIIGFISELIAENFDNYYGEGKVFCRVLLATPIIASTYYLHSLPNGMEVFTESAKHIMTGMGTLGVGALTIGALASPLFFGTIANFFDELLSELPAFNKLTQKMGQWLSQIKKTRQDKKALNALEKSETLELDKKEDTLLTEVNKQFATIRYNIDSDITRNNIGKENAKLSYDIKEVLNHLSSYSSFILSNSTMETLEAKQEVISLVSKTLPQLALSYHRSLVNQEKDAIIVNTEKLLDVLTITEGHFKEIVNEVKEHQISMNNIDFEQAIEFTKTRFSKNSNTQKLKINH
jgi:hypothetical protein